MGYYSDFNISILDENKQEICDLLHQEIVDKISDKYHICFYESNKWYDHEEDMKEFSLKYPKYYFYFTVFGEETEDIWSSCFKNGKSVIKQARIKIYTVNDLFKD